MAPSLQHLRRYPELDGKTFLIGVGAAKAATSWVHGYLGTLPGVTASPLKEAHFFDTKFSRYQDDPWDPIAVKRAGNYLTHPGDVAAQISKNPHFQACIDRVAMIYDDNAYFAHFARIVAPDTRTLCEATPSYAVLGAEGFAYVKRFFASQAVTLKLLFILRDPVDRLWSQLRHIQQSDPEMDVTACWQDLVERPRIFERSDYRSTVAVLDQTFPAEHLLYLYYEELFTDETLTLLCAFAGAEFQPTDPTERRNETTIKRDLPPDAEAKLRDLLAPQYAFCRERFGRVPTPGWRA
jgi:hypothetical protein